MDLRCAVRETRWIFKV